MSAYLVYIHHGSHLSTAWATNTVTFALVIVGMKKIMRSLKDISSNLCFGEISAPLPLVITSSPTFLIPPSISDCLFLNLMDNLVHYLDVASGDLINGNNIKQIIDVFLLIR